MLKDAQGAIDNFGSVSTRTLRRIATALGEPENVFVDDSSKQADVKDTVEMLEIWQGLEHAADRQKLLAFARSLAKQDSTHRF